MKVMVDPRSPLVGDYPDLTPGNTYRVIGIEADDLRLLNDEGLPYLYPPELFAVVEADEPGEWTGGDDSAGGGDDCETRGVWWEDRVGCE